MKKNIIITTFFIIALLIVLFIVFNKKSDNSFNKENIENNAQKSDVLQDINSIEEIKNEINATASSEMYEVQEEYDGRKIIQIRSDIQFDTILAGILKNGKPKETEIQELLKNRPNKSGIWISKNSREKFMELLKNNNITGCEINEEGYVTIKEKISNQKLLNAINSDKLYIIDIQGGCFTRDELSGEIVEYPFEDMEPDQILENYSIDNSTILEVTTNSNGILSNKEILEDILQNLE